MSGAALNAGFQFDRSKVPYDKSWLNAYDQVQTDWSTRKRLTRKWALVLERRMRHRKVQTVKEGCKGKRVFVFSKRVMDADGVYGKGTTSFWKPIVVHDMLDYMSTVSGICVGTVVFVLWTKRMSGADSYDPPGRFFVGGDGNRSIVEVTHLGSIGKSAALSSEIVQYHRPVSTQDSGFGGSRHYRITAFGRGSEFRHATSTMGISLVTDEKADYR